MLAYRVFPHLPMARPRQPGHPLYVHRPQGPGRWDNRDRYVARYLALDPAAAVAEVFAGLGLRWWTPAMFRFPALSGATRSLGV
ncbi:MAG: RES domain-containing protein, partial [Acidimicrobiales bacterium]